MEDIVDKLGMKMFFFPFCVKIHFSWIIGINSFNECDIRYIKLSKFFALKKLIFPSQWWILESDLKKRINILENIIIMQFCEKH